MAIERSTLIVRILLFVGTITSLFFVPWLLIKAWILPLPDSIQEQMNQAIDHGFDGMIVYVDQAGKPPQSFAAGWHNRESELPAKPNALFKIASIKKLFDAVSVAKLVNANRLSLDKSVADYFPNLLGRIEFADKITLKMMVQHRSGMPNFTNTPNFWASPPQSFEESLALILDKPANFKPGEEYEYCNTNYLLIQKIIENELGYDSFTFIQDEILFPLAMKNSFSSLTNVDIQNVMSGYHVGHPYDLKEDEHGMLSTAEDIGKFIRALNDGSVFQGNEQKIYASIYEFEHSGWVPGYQSFAEYHDDIDAVVVQFYSNTDPELYNWNLSQIVNGRIHEILKRQ